MSGPRRGGANRRLLSESAAARHQFLLVGALSLAMACAIVAQAALLAHLIAAVLEHRATLRALSGSLLALALVLGARALISGLFEGSGALAAGKVLSLLRGRLLVALLRGEPRSAGAATAGEDGEVGSLLLAAVQGIDALSAYFAGYLPQAMLAIAVPAAAIAWLAPSDPIAAGILAATLPLLVLFMVLAGSGARRQARARWRSFSLLSAHFLDVITGLPTLRAHRREQAQAETIERVGERLRRETLRTLRIAFLSALVMELCAMVGTALLAATIGLQLDGGALSLQVGLMALLLAPEIYAPIRALGQRFHASTEGLAAAERIFAQLEQLGEPEPECEAAARPLSSGASGAKGGALAASAKAWPPAGGCPDPAQEGLRFDAVRFSYPDRERTVLPGVSLHLPAGQTTILTGPSGAGKSTLGLLALRLLEPSSGAVRCGASDLRTINRSDWHRRVAWLPQQTRVFAGSIAENIALSRPAASRAEVGAAAERAGLSEVLAEVPGGLDCLIGEGGRRLSAGQVQRLGLARVLLGDAGLVVLDEPFSHLDRERAIAVEIALQELARGRTLLLIAHQLGAGAAGSPLLARAERAGGLVHLSAAGILSASGRGQPAGPSGGAHSPAGTLVAAGNSGVAP